MKSKHLLLLLPAAAIAGVVFAQGPLTPPGAPGPLMKTLEQVEPRTDLATLPGDADYHHIITIAGSYYMTGNLDVTKPNGVDVRAKGVTIDLNGFEIRRAGGVGGNGIEVDTAAHRSTIKNGSIKGFAYGMRCVGTTYARGGHCRHLSVSGCSATAIRAGGGWQLEACTAHDNTGVGIDGGIGSTLSNCTATATSSGNAGIRAPANCSLINCTAANNSTVYGIFAGSGSTLTNCSAVDNTGTAGISAGEGCTLMNCSAYSNTVTFGIAVGIGNALQNCTARLNTSAAMVSGGIDAGTGCTLIGCGNTTSNAAGSQTTGFGIRILASSTVRDSTIDKNRGDGIRVAGDGCQVVGNTCRGDGSSAGIRVLSNGCRIDGNHWVGVGGFVIDGVLNLIVRNSAQSYLLGISNYSIRAGNRDAARVMSPGASASPWANFDF